MSIATLILGQSGTGKSTSLRNLNPDDVLLIQVVKKPLPFRSAGWKYLSKDGGSIYVSDNPEVIIKRMQQTTRPIIVIDDYQYVMANEYMRRSQETGFTKFTEIGRKTWDVFTAATQLADNKRVYILSHTEENDAGKTKIKTIGKMLDEKITLEGMVTICLQTAIINEQYVFMTKNNGHNTVKSPIGLFDHEHVENDMSAVDKAICEYYGLTTELNQTEA
jgi:hypothetical protein